MQLVRRVVMLVDGMMRIRPESPKPAVSLSSFQHNVGVEPQPKDVGSNDLLGRTYSASKLSKTPPICPQSSTQHTRTPK